MEIKSKHVHELFDVFHAEIAVRTGRCDHGYYPSAKGIDVYFGVRVSFEQISHIGWWFFWRIGRGAYRMLTGQC